MILVLWLSLALLCWFAYKIWGSWMAPAPTFIAGFLFCCTWALVYSDRWDLDLHFNTYFVIAGGCLLFLFVGHLVFTYYNNAFIHSSRDSSSGSVYVAIECIDIEKWKLFLVVCVQIFAAILTIREIMSAAGTLNLAEAIHYYNTINKFSEDTVQLGHARLIWILWINMQALGFWFGYVFANNLAAKRFSVIPLIIVLLSMVNCLARGARTNAALMVAVILCYYLILLRKSNPKKLKNMQAGLFIRVTIVVAIFILTFKQVGLLMGRTITSNSMDYVSMYVGAEIKNLDTFLQGKTIMTGLDLWGGQTFMALYGAFKDQLGITGKLMLDLPDQYVNGLWLGNVYTTFYPYIYDFGYMGVVVLVAIMSLICHIAYHRAIRAKFTTWPSYSLVLYGYLWCSLVLSFFSNKFYERSFSETFLLIMICWGIYSLFFCKFRTDHSRELRRKRGNHSFVSYTRSVNWGYVQRGNRHSMEKPRSLNTAARTPSPRKRGGVDALS
jgi:oligosaccharide repeat unit polymerase